MDKISEMLTRIRNAQAAGHKEVSIGFSKFKFALAKILEKEGFIKSAAKNENEKSIEIFLKYYQISNSQKIPAINGLKRMSKSGKRVYVRSKDIKEVRNKYGIALFSTSKGVMTGEESKKSGLGGEYICEIW